MFFLALSGFYIHYPIFAGSWVWPAACTSSGCSCCSSTSSFRIIARLLREGRDHAGHARGRHGHQELAAAGGQPSPDVPWVKYYLFLKKDHPISAKYGVLQKIAYLATPFLILAAAYTGFCLWGPTSSWPFFHAGTVWVASLFNAGGGGDPMAMRILHYCIMWVILIFTAVHVYLANIYNFAPSAMIFAWKESVSEALSTRAVHVRASTPASRRRAPGNRGPFFVVRDQQGMSRRSIVVETASRYASR